MADTSASLPSISEYNVMKSNKEKVIYSVHLIFVCLVFNLVCWYVSNTYPWPWYTGYRLGGHFFILKCFKDCAINDKYVCQCDIKYIIYIPTWLLQNNTTHSCTISWPLYDKCCNLGVTKYNELLQWPTTTNSWSTKNSYSDISNCKPLCYKHDLYGVTFL